MRLGYFLLFYISVSMLFIDARADVSTDLKALGHDIWPHIESCGFNVRNAELFKKKLIADNDIARVTCLKLADPDAKAFKKRESDMIRDRRAARERIRAMNCSAPGMTQFQSDVCAALK